MNRGGKLLSTVAILAIAACGGNQGKLEIRATQSTLAPGKRPVPLRIAEAQAQLALGNVALALEAFRRALREDPGSIEAQVGIAECYDRIARFDLSRRHYEAALAIAPGDAALLGAFAASLERQGHAAEAASVRREIALRLAAVNRVPAAEPAATRAPQPGADRAIARAEAPALGVPAALAPAALPEQQSPATAMGAKASRVEAPQVQAAPVPPASAQAMAAVEPAPQPASKAVAPAPPALAVPIVGRSITVKLPPPRPVAAPVAVTEKLTAPTPEREPAREAPSVPAARQAELGATAAPRQMAVERPAARRSGPRLERLSMGEVALVTVAGPTWRAQTVARSDRSTTVRFIPLRQANARPRVELLNAARVHRLAARTRAYLASHGWRGIAIGDAPAVRRESLVLYAAGQRAAAQKLAEQFGYRLAQRRNGEHITILLGRDSIRHVTAPRG